MKKRIPIVLDENDGLNDQEPPYHPVVDDGYMDRRENDLARVEEALQIPDREFCRGFLEQLYDVTGIYNHGDTYFSYALSILGDYKIINKTHATLVLEDIRCQMAERRISENASKPIEHDVLPSDLAWAQYYNRDLSTLPKRHMKIDNQPVVEFELRWLCRLTKKRIELLDAIRRYEAAANLLNKSDPIILARGGHSISERPVSLANGRAQSALVTPEVLPKPDSTAAKKSNGHTHG